MPVVDESDRDMIGRLHSIVFRDREARDIIETGFDAARQILDGTEYTLPYSSFNVSVAPFRKLFPEKQQNFIGLCRVFILRASERMVRAEIHRNSVQRLVSYQGNGSIYSALPGGIDVNFVEYAIQSPSETISTDIDLSWDIVAANTWHYPQAAPHADWYTVTFHSADEADIIDEYWGDDP